MSNELKKLNIHVDKIVPNNFRHIAVKGIILRVIFFKHIFSQSLKKNSKRHHFSSINHQKIFDKGYYETF